MCPERRVDSVHVEEREGRTAEETFEILDHTDGDMKHMSTCRTCDDHTRDGMAIATQAYESHLLDTLIHIHLIHISLDRDTAPNMHTYMRQHCPHVRHMLMQLLLLLSLLYR